jgi:DNA-binding response OmpR family regulator
LFCALNILVVEDYHPLQHSLIEVLKKLGHHAQGLDSAEAFDEEAKDHRFDLMIIDVNLPGEDGFSLAKRLRKVQPGLGIIILTAKAQTEDKVNGYQSGADMYLTKPVGFDELTGAVNALARRLKSGSDEKLMHAAEAHAIEIHTATSSIAGSKGTAELTTTEFTLLIALSRAKDKSLELWQIYDVLGKDEQNLQKSALEAQLYRLRKKMSDCGAGNSALKSLRIRGYRINCPKYIK